MHLRELLIGLIALCLTTGSCSQVAKPAVQNPSDNFVGATPADSLIRAALKIPATDSCDFIKWDLSISKSPMEPGHYTCTALYGKSQPNTNGFTADRKEIKFEGSYQVSIGTPVSARRRVIQLSSEKLLIPILLVELDSNLLHFAGPGKNLLVGNGGYSYVLNKTTKD